MTKKEKIEAQKMEEMFAEFEGDNEGYEGLTMDVQAIPFIKIIQQLSPQLSKKKPEYLPEAEEGFIYNSVTNRLYEPPVRFVIGKFERYYIEWKPNRGGFVDTHLVEEIEGARAGQLMRDENYRLIDPNTGNIFSDTYVYYIIFPDHLEDGVCILSLTSSQLKEAKKLNRNLTNTVIPGTTKKALPYFMIWNLEVHQVSNDKGDWSAPKFTFDSFVTKQILLSVSEERKALPNKRLDLALLSDDAGQSNMSTDGNTQY